MREPTDLRPLFPRQRRLVALVAEGLRNKEIACRMNLQENTVKIYMSGPSGVFARTGCETRGEVILWVYREILDTEEESRL